MTRVSVKVEVPDEQLPAGTKIHGFTLEKILRERKPS
jgi:hypothetical protein